MAWMRSSNLLKSAQTLTFQRFRKFSLKDEPDFGICFDIDGVLARGYVPLPHAVETIRKVHGKIPITFMTNALSRHSYKAYQLGEWFGVPVQSEQMVMAQSALAMFQEFRDKQCLLVGQGPLYGIAEDMGFTKTHWMEDLALAYPMLDVVDHQKRYEVSSGDIKEFDFPKLEAVFLLGEPKRWDTCLQLILDVLLCEGKPTHSAQRHNQQTVPVLACNLDLQYMHRAAFPRYGHGAFVMCLETLFKKVTGKDLEYTAIVGKPSEATFRFNEHCLSKEAKRLGIKKPLRMMYMIGDNIDVDIMGANLYQRYIDHLLSGSTPKVPPSRLPPPGADILPQTMDNVRSVLVRTGVYQEDSHTPDHSHRDFPRTPELLKPTAVVDDIVQALEYIMLEENV